MRLLQKFYQAAYYIKYWLYKVNAHSLHTPALFRLYTQVIQGKIQPKPEIEKLRLRLLRGKEEIHVTELGAGSSVSRHTSRRLSSIARYSTTPLKFSLLLQRLILHVKAKNVVELGTSLGINTAYLATAYPGIKVVTFEGCANTAAIAKINFSALGLNNIEVIEGNLDETLQQYPFSKVDLAYLDANHRLEPTLRYVEMLLPYLSDSGVIILDDIHWSKEMHQAWNILKQDTRFTVKLDLFEAGLLIADKNWQTQHMALHY